MSKKLISVLLVAVMVLAMGTVALVSVSADLASLPEVAEGCYRYYFYMPDQWLNEYTEATGNTAGIYWWAGTGAHTTWPGQAAEKADFDGVYYCDVPVDVTAVVWSNFLDGGVDITNPQYQAAVQTVNVGTEYYDPDESPLYPAGTDNFDGMIYVTDFNKTQVNDYSGKMTYAGEWYYYYGDGKYGVAPVEGDSEVLTDPALNWTPDYTIPEDTGSGIVPSAPETSEPVETAPVETAPVETEPVETAPVETAPATNDEEEVPETPVVEQNAITLNDGVEYPFVEGDVVTYTVDVTAARLFENIQALVNYDSSVLSLTRIKSDDPDVEDWEVEGPAFCPNLEGVILNAGTEGVVKFNASKVAGYNFKEGANLITLEFTAIADAATSIDLVVEEMTIKGGDESYFTGGQQVATEGIEIAYALTGNTVVIPSEPATDPVVTDPVVTDPVETAPVETKPVETEPVETEPVETEPVETAPSASEDATSATDGEDKPVDKPVTGAAAYIYVVLAVLTMAAGAVVVLRKRANG